MSSLERVVNYVVPDNPGAVLEFVPLDSILINTAGEILPKTTRTSTAHATTGVGSVTLPVPDATGRRAFRYLVMLPDEEQGVFDLGYGPGPAELSLLLAVTMTPTPPPNILAALINEYSIPQEYLDWLAAAGTAVADGADLVDANDLGDAAYQPASAFETAGAASTVQSNLTNHMNDTTAAHDDSAIGAAVSATNYTPASASVEGHLSGIDTKLGALGGSAAWGAITGTLASQTDLQGALDAKAALTQAITASGTGEYRMVACVIRNNAGTWELINDSQHEPLGIASIAQDGVKITLTFAFTGVQVVSSSVTPDEQYAGRFAFGASVAVGSMTIYCYRQTQHSHKSWLCTATGSTPYFTVGANDGSAMAPAAVTWNAGELTIQHNAAEAGLLQGVAIYDPMGWEVNPRNARNTINYSNTYLKFYTLAGVQITDPALFPVGYRFLLERANVVYGYGSINPGSSELQISNSNVWVMALLKMS